MKPRLSLIASVLVLALSTISFAQTQSEPESLSLIVKLQSAYNPGFTLCMPIRTDNELVFAWTRDIVRSNISALVSKSAGGTYHLKFELKEGVMDEVAYDVKAEPDLKPDVAHELSPVPP